MGNMINKKLIITTVLSAFLIAGNAAIADSNDLLRMDVKKASSDDTVDVTFYTTGGATNSVVTRKSGNTYVVLLPNVAGNQSIVPSLGGVKDLVSDVSVKNVDDGIGGYTKVTFNTTKPVKIQTYTKRTAPLTKAQQDYKNLIAQNSKFDPDKKMENFKKASSTVANNTLSVKPAVSAKTTQKTATSKPVELKNTAKASAPAKSLQTANKIAIKPVNVHVPAVKSEAIKSSTPISNSTNVKPKTETKIETKIETKPQVEEVKPTMDVNPAPVFNLENPPAESKNAKVKTSKKANKSVKTKTEHKGLPVIPVAGALSVVGILILGGLINILARIVGSNSNKLKEYLENYRSENNQSNSEDYQKIIDNDSLNWQEKYKLYSQAKENEQNTQEASYITKTSGKNGVIVDDMAARVSQMEHALSQTPSLSSLDTTPKGVRSEDDAITGKMSELKLKTFANSINLKETSRHNIAPETMKVVTEPSKEGKFVKLKNSELSVSRRNIGGHGFSISDLVRKGRRYLPQDNEPVVLDKEQEKYILSSIEEYLNILDNENSKVNTNASEKITNLMSERRKVTNPMSDRKSYMSKQEAKFGGVTVKSKYDIDSERSIFMVDSDGVSAIIGKIGENIFVLKKFDKIINKPLQVRLDYGSVYIVRVGGFKCLVDVAEEKMGTLLEI